MKHSLIKVLGCLLCQGSLTSYNHSDVNGISFGGKWYTVVVSFDYSTEEWFPKYITNLYKNLYKKHSCVANDEIQKKPNFYT